MFSEFGETVFFWETAILQSAFFMQFLLHGGESIWRFGDLTVRRLG